MDRLLPVYSWCDGGSGRGPGHDSKWYESILTRKKDLEKWEILSDDEDQIMIT